MAFRDLIESKKYLKIRKKYLEMSATLPNRKLDARVNSLLQEIKEYPTPIAHCDTTFDALIEERNKLMEAKEKSPQKREKKKPKKDKKKIITHAWDILLERYNNRSRT